MIKFIQTLGLAFGLALQSPVWACSAFEFGSSGQGGLAHNFDWYQGMGFSAAWFVNARNVTKSGLNLYDTSPVATWTSIYGSVTYTLVGREFPVGGQNEKGLVIHAQQINAAQYPNDQKPELDALQWIQFVLDTSATVDEAVQNAQTVRPNGILNLHYILCDASTACAVVEFVNRQMVTYKGAQLLAKTMTNTDYPTSLNAWQSCQSENNCTFSNGSLERFVRAANYSVNYSGQDPLAYALSGLNAVAQTSNPITRYHFFNPAQPPGLVYFMAGTQTQWQSFEMTGVDFSCKNAGAWFEVDLAGMGDQSRMFQPYSQSEQQKLVAQVPTQPSWVKLIEDYPSTTICHDQSNSRQELHR